MSNLERFEEIEIENKKIEALWHIETDTGKSKDNLEKLISINYELLGSIEEAKKKFSNFAAIVLVLLVGILIQLVATPALS
jgi:hypothetical protein